MTEAQELFKKEIENKVTGAKAMLGLTDSAVEEVLTSVMHGIDGHEEDG
ncbi:hypothetical protein [Maridesulfovibrio sp.]|nr:hypothetical protein [Maridesulfovibrio sp.]